MQWSHSGKNKNKLSFVEEELKEMEQGWRKGPWTPEEDKLLSAYVELHGEGRWTSVAIGSGLNRNGKSCRLRWVNYLRPGLKRGHLTPQEEAIIIELHALWGNRWSTIARYLPGRTDNEIKNYWRTHFKEPKAKEQPKRKAQIVAPKLADNKKLLAPTAKDEQMMMKPCGRDDPAAMADEGFLCEDSASWAAAEAAAEDILWGGLWDAAGSEPVVEGSSLCFGEDCNIFCSGGFIF